MDLNLSKLWERVEDRGDWCAAVLGVSKNWTQLDLVTEQQQNHMIHPFEVYNSMFSSIYPHICATILRSQF